MQRIVKYLFVGSTNPVKRNAVRQATESHWPKAELHCFDVASKVPEQPMTDAQTRRGARNRAKAAFKQGLAQLPQSERARAKLTTLGFGLEGGVFKKSNGELWSTVWVAVSDHTGNYWEANGARFQVPPQIAKPIIEGGEMGPVLSEMYYGANIRQTNGAIGVVTNNYVTRTEEYGAICKLAVGLWFGQDWMKQLHHSQY